MRRLIGFQKTIQSPIMANKEGGGKKTENRIVARTPLTHDICTDARKNRICTEFVIDNNIRIYIILL